MRLLDGLKIGYSGAHAAQAGVQLVGHSIANANTEGFSRRRALFSPQSPPPVLGAGVSFDGVERIDDRLLARQIASALGQQGSAESRAELHAQIEAGVNIDGEGGLADRIDQLFTAFSALANDPTQSGSRDQVLDAARGVADGFRDASARLTEIAGAADREVAYQVESVNQIVAEIGALNRAIGATISAGGNAADDQDRRDLLVDQLSEKIGARSVSGENGQINVLIGNLTIVAGEHTAKLEGVADASLGGNLRVDFVDGGQRISAMAHVGGNISGLVQVRDVDVGNQISQLDQLAYDLGDAINTQHQAGVGLDGSSGLNLFSPAAAVGGAAAQMTVNSSLTADQIAAASSVGSLPGGSQNALLLAQIADTPLASGKTATQSIADIAGAMGSASAKAQRDAAVGQDLTASLSSLRDGVEGVSLDEEMINLVQYQRSYQANVRVIQTMDQLLGTLMEL